MFNAREKVEPYRGKNIRLKDFMKEYLHCKENANIVTYVLLFAYTAYTVSIRAS